MSIEVVVEPYSSWRQQHPQAPSGPAASGPRCPPGCVPAPNPCPPGYHRQERLYKCYPVNPRQRQQQRLSPRIEQIIDNQLRKIHEGQQHQAAAAAAAAAHQQQQQQLQRTQSDIALSQNAFAFSDSPQPIVAEAARASGYALAHSASVSASVDQLPAAIKEVLSVADNVVPEAGKVTYINTASCNPDCQQRAPSPPCAPSPPPAPRQLPPRRISQPRIVYRPSSPYEVLPVIHVDRCDKNDPCNRNRVLDADCAPTKSSRLSGTDNYMTIEIEISKC